MTNLLQPADVCWFSSIKKSYKAKWMDWFIYDPKTQRMIILILQDTFNVCYGLTKYGEILIPNY